MTTASTPVSSLGSVLNMSDYPTIPLSDYEEYPLEEMRQRLGEFYAQVSRRRTVREFSNRPVPPTISMWTSKVLLLPDTTLTHNVLGMDSLSSP